MPIKPNQLIQVAVLFSSTDAHILRIMLEYEGVTVFIFDEGFAMTEAGGMYAVGGIKVNVPHSQKDKAVTIVNEYYKNLKNESTQKCPNCKSTRLAYDFVAHVKIIFTHIIGIIFTGSTATSTRAHYKKCLECGHKW